MYSRFRFQKTNTLKPESVVFETKKDRILLFDHSIKNHVQICFEMCVVFLLNFFQNE